jgi:hypothetical protein
MIIYHKINQIFSFETKELSLTDTVVFLLSHSDLLCKSFVVLQVAV